MSYYDVRGVQFRPISTWPGQRTAHRQQSKFKATWGDTLKLLRRELGYLGAKNIIRVEAWAAPLSV